jgi:acyl-CoA reductase-like NAD-dependent aldehyde dehydrogenase
MGQARLRGTKEERDAEAVERIHITRQVREAERDRKEAEQEAVRSAKWKAMTPEQREAALKRAGAEMAMHSDLADMIGMDAASVMMAVFSRKKA